LEAKENAGQAVGERVMSIDALRGFDMFWIVGGGATFMSFFKGAFGEVPVAVMYQIRHPAWEGFSAWDMIMPLFLFVVGAAMPFSFSKRLQHSDPDRVYARVLRRTVLLFLLGMIAQGNLLEFDLSKLHLYSNTLQAIASGYLVAAVLLLNFSVRVQAFSCAAMLVTYWVLMMFVPVNGQTAGVLEPYTNFALAADTAILGRFRDGTTYTWTVTGLGFSATTLMGVMAGHVIKSQKPAKAKLQLLTGAGAGCLALGWVWSFHFPIIKHIWTSSMALWAGGWSFLLLAAFYYVIDVKKYRKWAFFFVVIGMNAIAVYMATQVFNFRLLGDALTGALAERAGNWRDFIRELSAFAIVWLLLLFLYRKKVFIKV